ncbi:MAG: hypothetical protein AMJ69_07420 [Gammaproteobacteria bacterium SG8_47]|nr:MAG: hypothetical protein AMJ69_07420 [Gammaproteobacteria bacterium SG8_47]
MSFSRAVGTVFALTTGVLMILGSGGGGGGGGDSGNEAPLAIIETPQDPVGDVPLDVAFDGSSSSDGDGSIASYSWDFGDGASGSGANATHQYTSAGNYTVTLTVTDDGGLTDVATMPVSVGGDLEGIWMVTETVTSNSAGDACDPLDDAPAMYPLKITRSGSTLALEYYVPPTGGGTLGSVDSLVGSITGADITWEGSRPFAGGTRTVAAGGVRASLGPSCGNFVGQIISEWQTSDGSATCAVAASIVAQRAGSPTPDCTTGLNGRALEQEPNSRATAQDLTQVMMITPPVRLIGTVMASSPPDTSLSEDDDQRDQFMFNVPAEGSYSIVLSGFPTDTTLALRIKGDSLASDINLFPEQPDNVIETLQVLPAGDYYIVVNAVDTAARLVGYELVINPN